MLLSYTEIRELVDAGVVKGVADGAINATSIDVRLGTRLLIEDKPAPNDFVRDLSRREPIALREVTMDHRGFIMTPGQFVLAGTMEQFFLPDDISMQFLLKSSMGRNGLEHANSTWCDAGWRESVLTLEIRNVTQYHSLLIKPGMFVGQMKVFKHTRVPGEQSYSARGRYNNDGCVQAIKP